MTIKEKKVLLAARLESLLHEEGFRVTVSLRNKDGRKKRGNAPAETWSPETDQIVVKYRHAATARVRRIRTRPARDFEPIEIRGEPLSATILRDRR